MRAWARAGIAIASGAVLLACGDGVSAPTATEERVYTQSVAPNGQAAAAEVRLGSRGATITISADWRSASNNIDVVVTSADCFDITPSVVQTAACLALAEANAVAAKPERLTFDGSAGGAYKVFVANRGAATETVTVRLTIH